MSEQPSQQPNQNLDISDSVLETVQIAQAGRDMSLTQIQGKVGAINVFGSVQVPQASLSAAKPLGRQEYEWRRMLLSKVKQFWIDGILRKSLHDQVLIELGLGDRSEYVPNPLEGVEEFQSDSWQIFPAGTSVTDIFEEIGAGRTLLILGEPGAGKTITLLKLAESLIERAENDLSSPLPVIVNLSSWAKQRKPMQDWLVQELFEIYQASKSLGKTWVNQEQLILLLDGLDEVESQYRNACVSALNQFIQYYGRTEIVVCCRIYDYEALSEQLTLRSAIYVQPLTPQQIDWYLEQVGKPLEALKNLLDRNAEIKSFASSPLILSIMSLAYQDCALDTLSKLSTADTDTSLQRLFDAYIKRMFFRRSNTAHRYSQVKSKNWLIWLARQMYQDSQTLFLIEKIQPNWLSIKTKINLHRLISGIIAGLIFGFIDRLFWLISTSIGLSVTNFVVGVISFGLGFGLIYRFTQEINELDTLQSRRGFKKRVINAIIVGTIITLLEGGSRYYYLNNVELPSVLQEHTLIAAIFGGIESGVIFGCLGGFLLKFSNNIKTFEELHWSSKKMKIRLINTSENGALFGIILGVIGGLIIGLIMWLKLVGLIDIRIFSLIDLIGWVAISLFAFLALGMGMGFAGGIIGGFVFGFLWGLFEGIYSQDLESKKVPNQGIYKSAVNAIVIGIFSGLLIGLILGVFSLLSATIYSLDMTPGPIITGLSYGLMFGYVTAITRGGGACIQHFSVRFILYCNDFIPWNYARFLDYATERLFLQKVGGGYIFIHRMLLEHFAAMEFDQTQS